MFDLLTWNDVFNAAFWAFVAVLLIRLFGRMFRAVVSRTMRYDFDPSRLEDVMRRFRQVFPIETLCFEGATIERGARIRITTNQQIQLEGEFIGTNHSNMVGIMLPDCVVTQEMNCIESIQPLGKMP